MNIREMREIKEIEPVIVGAKWILRGHISSKYHCPYCGSTNVTTYTSIISFVGGDKVNVD
jgi:predicted RNA-binding Zn-ribbon protein involved in translation (DUF1610 family)